MAATLNQWIATALFGLGIVLAAIGLYLGFFAWLNGGPTAGIRLGLTVGVFAAALGWVASPSGSRPPRMRATGERLSGAAVQARRN